MLASLSIRNIVLIDKLDIDFNEGLCVLTGETGAGKSILLDSLGLAIGARADCQAQRIEQYRFSGAGFTGQNAKTFAEIDIQLVD